MRMTTVFGSALATAVIALAVISLALLSGCTATPITLPFNDGGATQDAWDGVDAAADMSTYPDMGVTPPGDAGPTPADAAAPDSLVDGLCLECPLADGMADGGAGDAEAGPSADTGPQADALVGDLAAGE